MRRDQTEAERRLWSALRNRQLNGLKFRRQIPLGPYILDLVCFEALLVVEVDGGQHAQQQDYDAARTRFLKNQGLSVLRVWNNDVLKNLEGVLQTIAQRAMAPTPHPNPLPQGEREL